MISLYGMGQAIRITNVPQDSIDYWISKKLLAVATTAGGHRRFTFRDLVAISTIRNLRDNGVSLQAIRKVAERLQEAHGVNLSGSHLLVTGDDVLLLRSADELVSVLKAPAQSVMRVLVDLGIVANEVNEQIAKLKVA